MKKAKFALLAFVFAAFRPASSFCDGISESDASPRFLQQSSVLSRSLGSSDVDFFLRGFWDATLTFAPQFLKRQNQSVQASSLMPVFSQRANLSASALIANHWFFDLAVADGYERSAISAGYAGDGVLKLAKIGNNNIAFPRQRYSIFAESKAAPKNGQSISPGLQLEFGGPRWNADFMARYDGAENREKTFAGSSEISASRIHASHFDGGRRFVLPDGFAEDIDAVFVATGKNYSGAAACRDESGRPYARLDSSDYMAIPSQNRLIFAKSHEKILLHFASQCAEKKSRLGKFAQSGDGDGFLGRIEKTFGGTRRLAKYSRQSAEDFFIEMQDGREMMILIEEGKFSPFESLDAYKTDGNLAENAFLKDVSTGLQIDGFSLEICEDDGAFGEDELSRSNLIVRLSCDEADSADNEDPLRRFPLAKKWPDLYLLRSESSCDAAIELESYSRDNRFDIGANAIAETIRVYRNGVLTGDFDYNQETGEVSMRFAVSPNDKIRIVWQDNAVNFSAGNLSLLAGWKLQIVPELDFDVSGSAQWALSKKKYNDEYVSSPSQYAAAAGIRWNGGGFEASNVFKVAFQEENRTGIYRANVFSEGGGTRYLDENSALELNEMILPDVGGAPLDAKFKAECDVSTQSADGISGKAASLFFDARNFSEADSAWAAMNVDIGSPASLCAAQVFKFAVKSEVSGGTFRLFLQLGVELDKAADYEISDDVPTWELY